jgi:PadR family transcriptional regulator, regulatory protein PadR
MRQLRDVQLGDVAEASVYGTLRHLYRAGLLTSHAVASDAGPHRKYYGLLAHGSRHLALALEEWARCTSAMTDLVKT